MRIDFDLDLGSGFQLRYLFWKPDRHLNPQYDGLSDIERAGAIITCRHGVEGAIHFNIPETHRKVFEKSNVWTVQSSESEPLTLTPSIATSCCHGFITNGKWVDA